MASEARCRYAICRIPRRCGRPCKATCGTSRGLGKESQKSRFWKIRPDHATTQQRRLGSLRQIGYFKFRSLREFIVSMNNFNATSEKIDKQLRVFA